MEEVNLARAEASVFVSELGRAFSALVREYQACYGIDEAEAAQRADAPFPDSHLQRLQYCAPEDLDWHSFHVLVRHDGKVAARRWQEVQQAAEDELATGVRAARQVEDARSGPMERARFLALRQGFIDDWQPRGAVEQLLIDNTVQAYTEMERWLELSNQRLGFDCVEVKRSRKERVEWETARLTEAEATEQSMSMVERWNRIFIRNLRALRDLRRYAAVIIQNAPGGQVNVGGQQVNLQEAECPPPETPPRRQTSHEVPSRAVVIGAAGVRGGMKDSAYRNREETR